MSDGKLIIHAKNLENHIIDLTKVNYQKMIHIQNKIFAVIREEGEDTLMTPFEVDSNAMVTILKENIKLNE